MSNSIHVRTVCHSKIQSRQLSQKDSFHYHGWQYMPRKDSLHPPPKSCAWEPLLHIYKYIYILFCIDLLIEALKAEPARKLASVCILLPVSRQVHSGKRWGSLWPRCPTLAHCDSHKQRWWLQWKCRPNLTVSPIVGAQPHRTPA